MDGDELSALLEWMQAMQDAWKVTNGAVLSLAQSLNHYQVSRRMQVEGRRPAEAMAEVEQYYRDKLAALAAQSNPDPLPLRAKAGTG